MHIASRPNAAAPNPVAHDAGTVVRATYDARGSWMPPSGVGTLVRAEGDRPTGDAAVDTAHDNAGRVHAFLAAVLGHDSIDDRGMALASVVHFGEHHNDASWDGEKVVYGDGDGSLFTSLTGALDVAAHEFVHGVTQHTAGLHYRDQPGALNESFSDILGELVEQWHDDRAGFGTVAGARRADWTIGEDVFTPGVVGDAVRSLRAPGRAHEGDQQAAHMRDYVQLGPDDDNGGVHYNSGIPNKAAHDAAQQLGSEQVARIWFGALVGYLRPSSDFADAAAATTVLAGQLYGPRSAGAVADAWRGVGVEVRPARAHLVTARERKQHAPVTHEAHAPHASFLPPWLKRTPNR